jgi:hypothetical protein
MRGQADNATREPTNQTNQPNKQQPATTANKQQTIRQSNQPLCLQLLPFQKSLAQTVLPEREKKT